MEMILKIENPTAGFNPETGTFDCLRFTVNLGDGASAMLAIHGEETVKANMKKMGARNMVDVARNYVWVKTYGGAIDLIEIVGLDEAHEKLVDDIKKMPAIR